MNRTGHPQVAGRPGIVLLVVLALLTLFAIVGISFVLYANSEANASRFFREGEAPPMPDMDPEQLIAYFLNQLTYDTTDDYSGMRGHSLARSMYGWNTDTGATNYVAFDGTGRLRAPAAPIFGNPTVGGEPFNVSGDFFMPNYTVFPEAANWRHDPERPGWWRRGTDPQPKYIGGFNAPYTYPDLNNMFLAAVESTGRVLMPSFHRSWLFGSWTVGNEAASNPNWTNSYGKYLLLRPRPADHIPTGQTVSKFPYPEDLGGDVKNLIGSPGTLVTLPSGQTAMANNDSFWMDLGHPVMIAPDGTKYKPLFAPLIVDLDNRINLNVHGNDRGRAPVNNHCSNQGWGPWEVDISRVLNFTGATPDYWSRILTGNTGTNVPPERGRLNPDGTPTTSFPPGNVAVPGTLPHYYGPVDFDGCQLIGPGVRTPSAKLGAYWVNATQMADGTWMVPSFPQRPDGYNDGSPQERQDHPLLYNFFNPQTNGNRSDTVFPISNMEALLRYGETNSPGLTSSLYRLTASEFDEAQQPAGQQVQAARRRNMLTTHSFGLGRVAVSPWLWPGVGANPTDTTLTMAPITNQPPTNQDYPRAVQGIPFPALSLFNANLGQQFFNGIPGQNDFARDWRSLLGGLNKVDLNRDLTPYPLQKRTPNQPYHPTNNPYLSFNNMSPADRAQFDKADQDRQDFARDIYSRLVVATGAFNPFTFNPIMPPNGPGHAFPTQQQLVALRWLAQLAVNIVDYIDTDDIMTAFDWASQGSQAFTTYMGTQINPAGEFPTRFVFGTELPRVVINEVYAQYRRVDMSMAHRTNPSQYDIDVWMELYNPMLLPEEPNVHIKGDPEDDPGSRYLPLQTPRSVPLQVPGVGPTYEIVFTENLGQGMPRLRDTKNVTGAYRASDPGGPAVRVMTTDGSTNQTRECRIGGAGPLTDFTFGPWLTSQFIEPSGGRFQAPTSPGTTNAPINQGFYVLGPVAGVAHTGVRFPKGANPNPADRYLAPGSYVQKAQMTYRTFGQFTQGGLIDNQNKASILLRRLADPYRPYNSVSNPYITVDFWANVELNKEQDIDPATGMPTTSAPDTRYSFGRQQPFWGNPVPSRQKNSGSGMASGNVDPNTDMPQHTFFRQNAAYNNPARFMNPQDAAEPTLRRPFNWLTHLDRQLISPMELLQVSGFRPHELLQQFNTIQGGYPGQFSHYAPWFDQRTRLYRVFEFLETYNRAAGVARGGRIPGLVNVNTLWDSSEVFDALCASNDANDFTSAQVVAMFNQMKLFRTRSANGVPGPTDHPFLGMAAPHASQDSGAMSGNAIPNDPQRPLPNQGVGIMDSLLRSNTLNPNPNLIQETRAQRLLSLTPVAPFGATGGTHPYTNFQVLTKLFNNVTTRSNVFAVWLTVGFFKVTDDTTRPVKLGEEIGKAENRNIRHRMFAIVDRSNITYVQGNPTQPGGPPIFLSGRAIGTENYPNGTTHSVVAVAGAQFKNDPTYGPTLAGAYDGLPWTVVGSLTSPGKPPSNVDVDYGQRFIPGSAQTVAQMKSCTVDKVYNADLVNNLPPRVVLSVDLGTTAAGVLPTPNPFLMQLPYGPPGTPQNGYLGNPGPQRRFNPRDYPWVVRYFSIIQ